MHLLRLLQVTDHIEQSSLLSPDISTSLRVANSIWQTFSADFSFQWQKDATPPQRTDPLHLFSCRTQ